MEYMYNGNLAKLAGKTVATAKLIENDEGFKVPVLTFTDGTKIECMSDDEGNGGGSLWLTFGAGAAHSAHSAHCCAECSEALDAHSYVSITRLKGVRFCTKDCARKYAEKNKDAIPKPFCHQCQKPCASIWKMKGVQRGARFCSKDCCNLYRAAQKQFLVTIKPQAPKENVSGLIVYRGKGTEKLRISETFKTLADFTAKMKDLQTQNFVIDAAEYDNLPVCVMCLGFGKPMCAKNPFHCGECIDNLPF